MLINGKIWLRAFRKSLYELREQANQKKNEKSSAAWTKFMTSKVMEGIRREIGYNVYRKGFNKKEKNKGEYLNLDAIFVANSLENIGDPIVKNYDLPLLPEIVVELENSTDFEKIRYCLWKIICIRANVKVLVCYQKDKEIKHLLKDCLEKIIEQSGLRKNDRGELFVIVGNLDLDKKKWENYSDIDRYFAVFKLEGNKFSQYSFSQFS